MRYMWTALIVLPLGILCGSGSGEENPFSRPSATQERTPQGENGGIGVTQTESAGSVQFELTGSPNNEAGFDSHPETSTADKAVQPTPSRSPLRLVTPASTPTVTLPDNEGDAARFSTQTQGAGKARASIASPKETRSPQVAQDTQITTVGAYFAGQQAADPIQASPNLQVDSSLSDLPPVTPRRSPLFGPSIYGENRIAQFTDRKIVLPSLIAPTTNPNDIGSKKLPEDFSGDQLVLEQLLPEGPERSGDWSLTAYFWHAPNTYSHPLYFEDVMLERHGHQRFPALQPLISGGRFFATIPMLPYLMTINPACDYDYHLGHFRPGSRAPGLIQRPPYVRKAAVVQAAATAGAFIALP